MEQVRQAHRDWIAIDAGADRRAAAKRLARVHERVVGDGDDPGRLQLREVIAESWQRSSNAGVDAERDLAPRTVGADAAAALWEHSPLRSAARVLDGLLDEVGGAGAQVGLVCDARGRLLWIDGEPDLLQLAREIHLDRGAVWAEDAAGTNAMGTALAVRHPIQVFSAEHYSVPVHGWTCSAAPIRDPETGEQLGVIDLTGELKTAHPHSLALVRMAARMVEAEIAAERAVGHRRLVERFGHRVSDGSAHGLVSPRGTILSAHREEWRERRVEVGPDGGVIDLDGTTVIAEPLDGGGFLIWPTLAGSARERVDAVRLLALGRDQGTAVVAGRPVRLSRRHTELLTLLALKPRGLSAEQLAVAVYGDFGKPVTARAELSRLRAALGVEMESNPYRLSPPPSGDFLEASALIGAGDAAGALELYAGPLLPSSEIPEIVEARGILESRMRESLLTAGDADLLHRWLLVAGDEGFDLEIARTLARALPRDDPRRADALARLRRTSAAGA